MEIKTKVVRKFQHAGKTVTIKEVYHDVSSGKYYAKNPQEIE